MEGKRRKVVGKSSANTCFLLLEPSNCRDSGEIARKLSRCRGVKEVHLTSGRYGFVVSARADSQSELNRISSVVRKAARSKCVNVALSHFMYR